MTETVPEDVWELAYRALLAGNPPAGAITFETIDHVARAIMADRAARSSQPETASPPPFAPSPHPRKDSKG